MIRIFRATAEQVYNTYDTSSPAFERYLPMDVNGGFTPMSSRPFWGIRDGSGLNVPRLRGSEIQAAGGKLTHRAYWTDVQFFGQWAKRVGGTSTTPWPTDQKDYDLPSVTTDFGWSFDDDTFKRTRTTGVKVASATIGAGNTPDNPFLMFDYDLIGGNVYPNEYNATAAPDATAFPVPTSSDFATDPITFQECQFYADGAVRNHFDRFQIRIQNVVKPYFDNSRFANRIRCRGRTVTLTVHPLLEVATDARLKYEAVTALGNCYFLFTNPVIPGGMVTPATYKLDFRSNTFLDSVAEEMLLDADAYSEWTATAHLDTSAGDDFTITYTAPAA